MTPERLEELRQMAAAVDGPKSAWMDELIEEVDRLNVKVENLLSQNQDIARSNADHVGWHRDMVLQVRELRDACETVIAELEDRNKKEGMILTVVEKAEWLTPGFRAMLKAVRGIEPKPKGERVPISQVIEDIRKSEKKEGV